MRPAGSNQPFSPVVYPPPESQNITGANLFAEFSKVSKGVITSRKRQSSVSLGSIGIFRSEGSLSACFCFSVRFETLPLRKSGPVNEVYTSQAAIAWGQIRPTSPLSTVTLRPLGATGFALPSQYIGREHSATVESFWAERYVQSKITYRRFTESDVGEIVQNQRSLHVSHVSDVTSSIVFLLTSCKDPW